MYPSKRRARQQASRASSAAVRRDDARRRAVPHLFRPLKREKNRGIYDRAASRQEGKKEKKAGCFYQTSLGRTYVKKNLGKEEVEEKEEEGAYYARTILTKVSHRAPLGRRDQTIVPPCASRRARACSRRLSYLYVHT